MKKNGIHLSITWRKEKDLHQRSVIQWFLKRFINQPTLKSSVRIPVLFGPLYLIDQNVSNLCHTKFNIKSTIHAYTTYQRHDPPAPSHILPSTLTANFGLRYIYQKSSEQCR